MLAVSGLGVTATPFKCTSTICYGTDGGATHALFKETQYQMNRVGAAAILKWRPISVDGFIGGETVTAARNVFSKFLDLSKYSSPSSFAQLAGWISADRSIPDVLRRIADTMRPATAEAPAKIEARTDAFEKEGPAKTTPAATAQPDIKIPSPDIAIPSPGAPAAIPGRPAAAASPAKSGGGAIIWGVAVVAVVGLVGAAAYAAKRRKRR
jgi:hypothetical protein